MRNDVKKSCDSKQGKPEAPPRTARWIVKRLSKYEHRYALEGDLNEVYKRRIEKEGFKKARAWYRRQAGRSLPAYGFYIIRGQIDMISHYLKVALRVVKRNKAYSAINILGLAVGIAACMLILMWVIDELSWDRFHVNQQRLFRVLSRHQNPDMVTLEAGTSSLLGPILKNDYPEIIDFARFFLVDKQIVSYEDQNFKEDRFAFADASFLDMFSYPLINGDRTAALSDPYSVIITEETARRYFGEKAAVGRVLHFKTWGDLTVTGIIQIPRNSHIQLDLIASFACLEQSEMPFFNWWWTGFRTYILLDQTQSPQEVETKIEGVVSKYDASSLYTLRLQSLIDAHLRSPDIAFDTMNTNRGDIKTIRIFLMLAPFILIIASINFMNLTTARHSMRIREVGLRKVVGASRRQLMGQFFGEAMVLSVLSLVLACILVLTLLPLFHSFTGMSPGLIFIRTPVLGLGFIGLALLTGLLSGSYPAIFLSSLRPQRIFRGKMKDGRGKHFIRRGLVLVQFAITIALIVSTLITRSQVNYMHRMDLGYDKEHIVSIQTPRDFTRYYQPFKDALLQLAGIRSVTGTMPSPVEVGEWTTDDVEWIGKSSDLRVSVDPIFVGFDFFETFGMKIVSGRFFSGIRTADGSGSYILNEEAVHRLGLEDPVGMQITLDGSAGTIVGVVENFHHQSLHHPIEPLVFRLAPRECDTIFIKLGSDDIPGMIESIRAVWNDMDLIYPFEFSFLDQTVDAMYHREVRLVRLFNGFSLLAIVISCLGLFGLSAFMAERRTKEIGIRKALGASVSSVIRLLCREFVILVVIANLAACMIAAIFMQRWLLNFTYRIEFGLIHFILPGLIALLMATLTVGFQAARAALNNPIDSLRDE